MHDLLSHKLRRAFHHRQVGATKPIMESRIPVAAPQGANAGEQEIECDELMVSGTGGDIGRCQMRMRWLQPTLPMGGGSGGGAAGGAAGRVSTAQMQTEW
jgi:hypothetical protein